ncbi:MAG: hypothetical protein AAB632_02345 [Patescibacteria group bacterium]
MYNARRSKEPKESITTAVASEIARIHGFNLDEAKDNKVHVLDRHQRCSDLCEDLNACKEQYSWMFGLRQQEELSQAQIDQLLKFHEATTRKKCKDKIWSGRVSATLFVANHYDPSVQQTDGSVALSA